MFAHQEGAIAGGAQADDVGGLMDAAFADREGARRHMFGESERRVEGDFESGEIAVVDTDEVGAGIDGGLEFRAVVDFDEGAEAEGCGGFTEIAELVGGKNGGDQQDGIGAVSGGLENLRGVDGKVLAQDGQGYGGAGGFEMGEAALEERLVGEHAEGGGSAGLVGAGDAGGIEILHEDALTGRRLLDLGDDGGRTGGERGAEIAAGGEAQFGGALPGCKRWDRAREIFALFGDNTGQDVWNSVDQGCRSNGIRGCRAQRGDAGIAEKAQRRQRRSRIHGLAWALRRRKNVRAALGWTDREVCPTGCDAKGGSWGCFRGGGKLLWWFGLRGWPGIL